MTKDDYISFEDFYKAGDKQQETSNKTEAEILEEVDELLQLEWKGVDFGTI